MRYGLAGHVSFSRFPDRLIFLDIMRDRYFGVPLPTVDCSAGKDAPFSPELLERLTNRGLLVRDDPTRPICPVQIEVPWRSLVETNDARVRHRVALPVLFAVIHAKLALRRHSLEAVLAGVRGLRRAPPPHSTCSLPALVASFHHYRRLLPIKPRCLPDSLALIGFLASYGHYPTLIFGVLAYPFAAHCWVQTDEQILNDAYGHAAQFHPILIV